MSLATVDPGLLSGQSQYTNTIVRAADNACIPLDSANTDYQQYLQWVSEGNTPESADTVTQGE